MMLVSSNNYPCFLIARCQISQASERCGRGNRPGKHEAVCLVRAAAVSHGVWCFPGRRVGCGIQTRWKGKVGEAISPLLTTRQNLPSGSSGIPAARKWTWGLLGSGGAERCLAQAASALLDLGFGGLRGRLAQAASASLDLGRTGKPEGKKCTSPSLKWKRATLSLFWRSSWQLLGWSRWDLAEERVAMSALTLPAAPARPHVRQRLETRGVAQGQRSFGGLKVSRDPRSSARCSTALKIEHRQQRKGIFGKAGYWGRPHGVTAAAARSLPLISFCS